MQTSPMFPQPGGTCAPPWGMTECVCGAWHVPTTSSRLHATCRTLQSLNGEPDICIPCMHPDHHFIIGLALINLLPEVPGRSAGSRVDGSQSLQLQHHSSTRCLYESPAPGGAAADEKPACCPLPFESHLAVAQDSPTRQSLCPASKTYMGPV